MGVPHLRSRVMHLPLRPSLRRALVNWIELAVHWPFSAARSNHYSCKGWILGKSMNTCFDFLISGVDPVTFDLGLIRSTALRSFPHWSHWSPLAS